MHNFALCEMYITIVMPVRVENILVDFRAYSEPDTSAY